MTINQDNKPADEDQPPIFKSWSTLYSIVLILHTIIIYLFYLLTQAYS